MNRGRTATIAVLMTCHNRKQSTLASLAALAANAPPGVKLRVVLVDDGSTDGTREAVRERHPDVLVLEGDGSLFWNGGMRRAWKEAFTHAADFYLWLNDDTLLFPDAIERLLATYRQLRATLGKAVIVVGSTRDRATGAHSYGGTRIRSRLRPMKHDPVSPSQVPVPCDTFNGNVVLVPAAVADIVGNLEPGFVHAMGDTDYGLRAVKAGFTNWVMPGYAGTCSNNATRGTFSDRALPLRQRLRKMTQPKGLPVRPWLLITRRHAGPLWLAYWLWPYLRVIAGSLPLAPRRR